MEEAKEEGGGGEGRRGEGGKQEDDKERKPWIYHGLHIYENQNEIRKDGIKLHLVSLSSFNALKEFFLFAYNITRTKI